MDQGLQWELNVLQEKLSKFQTKVQLNPTQDSFQDFQKTESEINKTIENKTEAAICRTKTHWHNEGERSTKFFLAREKVNGKYKLMKGVRRDDGIIVRDKRKILVEQAKFYKIISFEQRYCI